MAEPRAEQPDTSKAGAAGAPDAGASPPPGALPAHFDPATGRPRLELTPRAILTAWAWPR